MAINFDRRCEMAQMAKADPSLFSNHLDSKLPEWLARQTAERIVVRDASEVHSQWLASQPGYESELEGNAAFIARLNAEIAAGNEALIVYKNYGWASAQ